MDIGSRIKTLRKQKGLNQTELAKIINLTSATLCSIELGKSNPTNEMVVRLSNFFGVSTDYLLTGKAEIAAISDDEIELLKILREDNALKSAVMDAANLKKKMISYLVNYQPHQAHAA